MSRYKHLIGNKHAVGSGGNSTSFKEGMVPWNKGVSVRLSPRTEFKSGRISDKRSKIGTVTVRIDKNGKRRRWIKISDTYPQWIIYSQWLWVKNNGPIPNGFLVHHLDGDTMNDEINNYCLVTRAQHINHHRSEMLAGRKKNYAWRAAESNTLR